MGGGDEVRVVVVIRRRQGPAASSGAVSSRERGRGREEDVEDGAARSGDGKGGGVRGVTALGAAATGRWPDLDPVLDGEKGIVGSGGRVVE